MSYFTQIQNLMNQQTDYFNGVLDLLQIEEDVCITSHYHYRSETFSIHANGGDIATVQITEGVVLVTKGDAWLMYGASALSIIEYLVRNYKPIDGCKLHFTQEQKVNSILDSLFNDRDRADIISSGARDVLLGGVIARIINQDGLLSADEQAEMTALVAGHLLVEVKELREHIAQLHKAHIALADRIADKL